MLTSRQKGILRGVVQDFIRKKRPVASVRLKERFNLEFSPATIRSELLALEKEGFLSQPHTSAGRIPREKAYRFYVDQLMSLTPLSAKERRIIDQELDRIQEIGSEEYLARVLGELSGNLGICSQGSGKVSYWGLPFLFSSPEFDKPQIVRICQFLDGLRVNLSDMRSMAETRSPQVFIGSECPMTKETGGSLIIAGFADSGSQKKKSFLALFGPQRMNYGYNVSLLDYVVNQLE